MSQWYGVQVCCVYMPDETIHTFSCSDFRDDCRLGLGRFGRRNRCSGATSAVPDYYWCPGKFYDPAWGPNRGWPLICDPPQQLLTQLAEGLSVLGADRAEQRERVEDFLILRVLHPYLP